MASKRQNTAVDISAIPVRATSPAAFAGTSDLATVRAKHHDWLTSMRTASYGLNRGRERRAGIEEQFLVVSF